jgi:RNA polymerase sigma factor (sigma-70 family)
LLERFALHGEEVAFEALVKRHGTMVWSVCRRVLRNQQDIEDAFQATFLVLVRKAITIRKRASLASWLHGVAYRIALKALSQRQTAKELSEQLESDSEILTEASYREVRAILDEEMLHLPERFRTPLLLCCLEGLTKAEAAKQLGWKEGTLSSRLARGRDRLQTRLIRRGVTLSASTLGLLLASEASAIVPISLSTATVRVAVFSAAGEALSGGVSTSVTALAKGILNAMALTKLKAGAALVIAVCALFAGAAWAAHQVLVQKQPENPDEAKTAVKKADAPSRKKPSIPGRIITATRCRRERWREWERFSFVTLWQTLPFQPTARP